MVHPNDNKQILDLYSLGYNDREIARRTGYGRGEIRRWRQNNSLKSNLEGNSRNISYKVALPPDKHPSMKRFLSLAAAVNPSSGISGLMKAIREEAQHG